MPLESFKQLAPFLYFDRGFIFSPPGRVEPKFLVYFWPLVLSENWLSILRLHPLSSCWDWFVRRNEGEFILCWGFDSWFYFIVLILLYSRKMIGFVRICMVWVVYIYFRSGWRPYWGSRQDSFIVPAIPGLQMSWVD